MASETLHFENARQAQQLFNNDPRNLQALAEQLDVKATSREGWIKLEGPPEAVERARQMFQLLEGSLKSGSPVRNREFAYALNVVKHEGASALKSLFDDRIQTSAKKAAVTPKTVGQKKYLEAIRQHDVTFGVGPAGTGKTYLAMAMAVQALKDEKVSSKGEFNSFSNVTSLPRPMQRPHPPFWIAATNTPETFAFAGANGCKVMAIPLEPEKMRSLIGTYRDAWRKAGHPGNGHVMNTFFMCCAPTRKEAMAAGLGPCNQHLKGLADAAKEWLAGASTKDYPGYDKLIAHVSSDTAERQMEAGSAFIGSPSDIVEMIRSYNDKVGGIDSVSLHFTPGNMPVDKAERSLRLFSAEVLPKVKGL